MYLKRTTDNFDLAFYFMITSLDKSDLKSTAKMLAKKIMTKKQVPTEKTKNPIPVPVNTLLVRYPELSSITLRYKYYSPLTLLLPQTFEGDLVTGF